jgi:hypothetical protein
MILSVSDLKMSLLCKARGLAPADCGILTYLNQVVCMENPRHHFLATPKERPQMQGREFEPASQHAHCSPYGTAAPHLPYDHGFRHPSSPCCVLPCCALLTSTICPGHSFDSRVRSTNAKPDTPQVSSIFCGHHQRPP